VAHRVEFARKATRDIFAIEKWILPLRQHVVARWQLQLSRAVRELRDHPGRFAEARETEKFGLDLRELLFGNRPHLYRVLFKIDGNTVSVLRILYATHGELHEEDL